MHKVLRIARREYRATVRTKGFIIGLVLAPVLMGGSAIAFALFKDRVDTRDKTIAVVDRSGVVVEALLAAASERNENHLFDAETGEKVQPAYVLEVVPPDGEEPDAQRLVLSDRVRSGELHGFVEIGAGVVHPRENPETARIGYFARSPALDPVRGWLRGPIHGALRSRRLGDAGIERERVVDLFDQIRLEGLGLVARVAETGEISKARRRSEAETILVPLALPMLLFIMLMMGAQPLLGAVAEEKSQRIAEVMLGSIAPFPFMLGKLLGGAAVSLTAAVVYLIGGLALISYMDLSAFVPYRLLPWFLVFMVAAIFMFGASFAALGAMCNDANEVQAVTLPAMLPVILPLFVLMPVTIQPQSGFATGLSLFPLFTPVLMLVRMGTPEGVPGWQPWVGLFGVLLCALLFVWAGGRIFRVGILMQGTPPRVGNLLRWAARG